MALVPEEIRNQEPDLSIRKLQELKDNTKMAFARAKRTGSWDNHPVTVAAKPLVLELLWLYSKNIDLGDKFKYVFANF